MLPIHGQAAEDNELRLIAQETEAQLTSSLPETVTTAVLEDIQSQWQVEPSQLRVTEAQPRLWSDGCLGLAPPGQFCQEVLVVGWQVTVAHHRQQWVYRSNNSGGLVRWDQAGSELDRLFTVQSQSISEGQKPARLPNKVIFREIERGGNTGPYQETLLFKNGRILQRQAPDAPLAEVQLIAEISPETVKTFRKFLEQRSFNQFDGLCYLAPTSSAEVVTTVLSSKKTTTCYSKTTMAQLPEDLQSVIQSWTKLAKLR